MEQLLQWAGDEVAVSGRAAVMNEEERVETHRAVNRFTPAKPNPSPNPKPNPDPDPDPNPNPNPDPDPNPNRKGAPFRPRARRAGCVAGGGG